MVTDRERAALRREAELRDARDKWRLTILDRMVAAWIDGLAVYAERPLEHPRRQWHPGDLMDELRETQREIARELERLKGPLVVEDDWGK